MATFVSRPGPGGKRVWQALIRRRGYPQQTRTFSGKALAEAWARQIESEMERGVFVSRSEAESTTLAEILDRYEKEVTPRKRGKGEDSIIRWWRASPLGSRTMASIRSKDVADVVKRKEDEGVGPRTVFGHLALLTHVFNLARKEWGMESLSNPAECVRRPRQPQARERRLVDDEESRILDAAKTYGGEIRHIIRWAVETAMRRGEIAEMRWEHLNKKNSVLLIPQTKNGTPRRVPLSSRAFTVLDALPRRIDGRVWSMRPDSISQAFERVVTAARTAYEQECKKAGREPDKKLLKDLRFHDLRHEATSRLFEKGLNPMEAAAITGHKTLQMLKRYTHLRAEDLVERLG